MQNHVISFKVNLQVFFSFFAALKLSVLFIQLSPLSMS